MRRAIRIRGGAVVALAMLLMPILAFWWVGAAIVSGRSANIAAIEERRATLQRLNGVAAQAATVEAWAAEVQRGLGGGILLAGSDPSVTAAALQSQLSETTAVNGAEVRSFRALPAVEADGFLDLGIALELRGGMASLLEILKTIDESDALLAVRRATLRAEQGKEDGEPLLEVELEVHGHLRPPAEAPPNE